MGKSCSGGISALGWGEKEGISATTLFLIIYFLCPDSLTQSGVGVHCPLEDALERRLRSRRGCDASYQQTLFKKTNKTKCKSHNSKK